jgi:hypothetical protein
MCSPHLLALFDVLAVICTVIVFTSAAQQSSAQGSRDHAGESDGVSCKRLGSRKRLRATVLKHS